MTDETIVYIVDDDEGLRKSMRAIVHSMGLRAETFESAEEFLEQFDEAQAGCVVTDLRMAGISGIQLQQKLADRGVSIPIIIVTAHAETPLTVQAVKDGATTVLEKPCRDYELVDAIRSAITLDSQIRDSAIQQKIFRERLNKLVPAEREVLDLMVDGTANKVIARRLDVSVRTVENRRQRIFEKTGTQSLAELVRLFVESHGSSNR